MKASTTIVFAEQAADEALRRVYACLDKRQSFLLEAGAGAGKTYSLVKALNYVLQIQGASLVRRSQRVACLTYTNVAADEIKARTDRHPIVHADTIHAFCWSLIRDFQPALREELPNISNWAELLTDGSEIGSRTVEYQLGYRKLEETHALLHHDDVLKLTVALMARRKFRDLFVQRYPVVFIDEYQDTNAAFADALTEHFLTATKCPVIGFFGDHWQKIYGTGCGRIDHPALEKIGKHANFRSTKAIVEVLNRMRPELEQAFQKRSDGGSVAVYHTNAWEGPRRTGTHWKGSLSEAACHESLEQLKGRLADEGWDFSPETTKILMLTHRVLAMEQGYAALLEVYRQHTDALLKKEDATIAFLADVLEPVCHAYQSRRFGEMFQILGGNRQPGITSHGDKRAWAEHMEQLTALRERDSVGAVLDFLDRTSMLRLPRAVERWEQELQRQGPLQDPDEPRDLTRYRSLREIPYREIIALSQFIDGHTPFSTKHGVKGAQFENVLVVVGRGWNQYDFNLMLELGSAPERISSEKQAFFERNRNLFYVACSRPKRRLAVLFTQWLSREALATLETWFGPESVTALGPI